MQYNYRKSFKYHGMWEEIENFGTSCRTGANKDSVRANQVN